MRPAEAAEAHIRQGRLVAIVRLRRDGPTEDLCNVLIEAGVRALEVTSDTPRVWSLIESLAGRFGPLAAIGAGTVMRPGDVAAAAGAGASFIVSPHADADVIAAARDLDVLSIPGALTPTEVIAARALGAGMVKLFPAEPLGTAYLRALRGPLPEVPLLPTGGIEIEDVPAYLAAGATAVGLGSSLVASGETLETIAARAARAVALARGSAAAAGPVLTPAQPALE
ncbi:MAG TPA: bifunctional 4-hydroxy-2-oxoglutarate aldolase/2-dehydro-3-deoxy-phosphogluconate aldolase [Candidatus Limnocylindrales bacterium]|nr:bifunctional 4-hydroxy-2-oxoglutarate aldolase/2-dehydro-3-deoxy-phosphogluconate aldolase [Candidatus Limnocylindrales bacterium]